TPLSTLSLHDALPIFWFNDEHQRRPAQGTPHRPLARTAALAQGAVDRAGEHRAAHAAGAGRLVAVRAPGAGAGADRHRGIAVGRSEEHTSELQSREKL